MTATPPDTAAALEAAIDAHKHDIIDHAALHRAITAHVEAEVARRLAAADSVDEAIEAFDEASAAHGAARRGFDLAARERAAAAQIASLDRLRAAIAADKARAVETSRPTPATSPAMVEAYKAGCEREATRRRSDGDYSYRPEDIIAAGLAAVLDVARPTPDEARRLAESILVAVDMHSREQRAGVVERIILRALGVEA